VVRLLAACGGVDINRPLRITSFPLMKDSAVNYFRMDMPLEKMVEQFKPMVKVRTSFPADVEDATWADICIFQQQQNVDYFAKLFDWCLTHGKMVIYETDDNVMAIPPTYPVYWYYRAEGRLELAKAMIHLSHYITTTTEGLKKELGTINKNIKILRNKLDLSLAHWNYPKRKNDKVHIGWAGSFFHVPDLRTVSGVITDLVNNNDIRFMLCGYAKGGRILDYRGNLKKKPVEIVDKRGLWQDILDLFNQIPEEKMEILDILPLFEYGAFYSRMDIAIAPLEDNRFNRCKSELKAIEAGAYSLPIVCADVEPYRAIIKHGENGFLARKPRHWKKYLYMLIHDKDLREHLGRNLRKTIEERYDAKEQTDRYEFYKGLVA